MRIVVLNDDADVVEEVDAHAIARAAFIEALQGSGTINALQAANVWRELSTAARHDMLVRAQRVRSTLLTGDPEADLG